jgi:hypothetical protein
MSFGGKVCTGGAVKGVKWGGKKLKKQMIEGSCEYISLHGGRL